MTDGATNSKSQRELIVELTVSAAVQENKLDTVIDTLEKRQDSDEKWRDGMSQRMRKVEGEQRELKAVVRKATGLNALWAAVAAAAAGFVGSKT